MVSVKPRSPPASMMAHSSVVSPANDRVAPNGSSLGAAGSFDSGTSGRHRASAMIATGMLIRKTEFQEKLSIRNPPVIGPNAIPSPDTAAQIPIAFGRSSAGKTLVRTDSVEGMMNAPPTPIRARLAISMLGESATAAATEPARNTPRPI